jgi:membrane-bound metal-dependent hydrolase YbcI (DUF457 family)
MMGPAHSASGLAVGALTLPQATVLGVHTLPGQLAWVIACGGFAYLPDLDQEGSTAGKMWGPPTQYLSAVIEHLAVRHRGGTHDIVVGTAAFTGVAVLAARWHWSALVLLALTIGLALHALAQVIPGAAEKTPLGNAAVSFAGAWWLTSSGHATVTWLPAAVALGVVTHIAGDWLTTDGVPVPFTTWLSRKPVTVGLRAFDAGRGPEPLLRALVFPLAALAGLYLHTSLGPLTRPLVHPVLAVLAQAAT